MGSIQTTTLHYLSSLEVRAVSGMSLLRCEKLMGQDTVAGERLLHRRGSRLRHYRVVQELLVSRDLRAVATTDVTTAHQQLEPTKAQACSLGTLWSEVRPMVDH